jgi:hypothetical protein
MKILNISTKEFLKEGLRLGEEALIALNKNRAEKGYKLIESNTDRAYNNAYIGAYMQYTKENITTELNNILNEKDYNTITYNSENVEYIIKKLNLNDLSHYEIKVLESVVYAGKCRKQEEAELKEYEKREAEATTKGYIKTPYWDNNTPLSEHDKIKTEQKALDHKKVIGIFNISKIGILGSFNEWVELEGTLIYSETHNTLMLMPKRHTRTGYPLLNYAYIKVIE